jgi:hypothetical protein
MTSKFLALKSVKEQPFLKRDVIFRSLIDYYDANVVHIFYRAKKICKKNSSEFTLTGAQ